jgi:hypothetical protein
MTFPNADSGLVINSIPQSENLIFHVEGNNCSRYQQVNTSVTASTANLQSQNEIRESYEENFLPRLRELTQMIDADT